MKGLRAVLAAATLAASLVSIKASAETGQQPRNYIFAGGSTVEDMAPLLADPAIEGIQIVYSWRQLETGESEYDFSQIERDLEAAEALGKTLWLQLQDRFFLPTARNLPDYLLTEPQYGGGLARQLDNPGEGMPLGSGWTAMQWNGPLRARFQALIAMLAAKFDGRIYGINLPETAFDPLDGEATGFDCDAYFGAELENALFARAAFAESHVVQYINFFPCEWDNDRGYMERFFDAALANGIGLGGPDIVPWRQGQMKNSYPFFNRHRGRLPMVAMAVQEPTLTYTSPVTGKAFTREEFLDFAENYLGVDIVFWSADAPWIGGTGRDR